MSDARAQNEGRNDGAGAPAAAGGPSSKVKSRGPWRIMWMKLRRDRMALFGAAVLIVLYLSAIFAGFLSPYHFRHQFRYTLSQPPMLLYGQLEEEAALSRFGCDDLVEALADAEGGLAAAPGTKIRFTYGFNTGNTAVIDRIDEDAAKKAFLSETLVRTYRRGDGDVRDLQRRDIKLTFTSGANVGSVSAIAAVSVEDGLVELAEPLASPIEAGDEFQLVLGETKDERTHSVAEPYPALIVLRAPLPVRVAAEEELEVASGPLQGQSYNVSLTVRGLIDAPEIGSDIQVRDAEGDLTWPYVYGWQEKFDEVQDKLAVFPDRTKKYELRFFHEGPEEDAYSIPVLSWIVGDFRTHLFGVERVGFVCPDAAHVEAKKKVFSDQPGKCDSDGTELVPGSLTAQEEEAKGDIPGVIYLLGSDDLGRDIWSRLLYGGQISLSIGLVGILISMTLGMLVGGFAGFYSDRTVRLIEIPAGLLGIGLFALPFLIGQAAMGAGAMGTKVFFFGLMVGLPIVAAVGSRGLAFRAYLIAPVALGALVGATQEASFASLSALYIGFWGATIPSLCWITWRLEKAVVDTDIGTLLLFDRTMTVDFLIMRVIEVILAVPGLYLILTLRFAFPKDLDSRTTYLLIVMILAFIGWASNARVIRGMVLSLREREFVLAARALGVNEFIIIVKHVLPNTLSYVIVTATLYVPYYILGEVALSFLGIGIQEPDSSWGLMLKDAQHVTKLKEFPWIVVPGFFIFAAVLAFNFMGDGLRDAADPRTVVAARRGALAKPPTLLNVLGWAAAAVVALLLGLAFFGVLGFLPAALLGRIAWSRGSFYLEFCKRTETEPDGAIAGARFAGMGLTFLALLLVVLRVVAFFSGGGGAS